MPEKTHIDEILFSLKEREKEMNCLYSVDEICKKNLPINDFLMEIVTIIPQGWQFPDHTKAIIQYNGKIFKQANWIEGKNKQSANIVISDKVSGFIEVHNLKQNLSENTLPFLPEEQKLLNTIASYINSYIFNKRLHNTIESFENRNLTPDNKELLLPVNSDIHWKWRYEIVEKIAEKLDLKKFGIKAMYLIGSVKNAIAGPASDIDIILHFDGNDHQKSLIKEWFSGWSFGIDELNFLRTGYRSQGIIDLHIVTDEDIIKKDSFASMIGAVTDGARLIKKRSDD